jgi:alpha-D-ribose 1-methylphosphonate 5-triphosphate synthase subunit PhnG
MTQEKVFEALMQADRYDIAPVAEMLKREVEYTVVKNSAHELVMFQVEENVEKLDFNVGEVLVTSAEVRVQDAIGYSMVMGMDGEKALDCALLMGVYEAGLPQKKAVEALAAECLRKMEEGMREERRIASSTRVKFELMGGQDPNVAHAKTGEDDGGEAP